MHPLERAFSERLRRERVIVDSVVGPVVGEPSAHVHALLEVPRERKAQEWPARRDELHARAQAALHERQVAARQVLEEVVHVRPDLEAVDARELLAFETRTRDENELQI